MADGEPSDVLAGYLAAHAPESPTEDADLDQMRALAATADPWDRALPVHVTASALIVHPGSRRVLLRWHARQQAWLHVGGHANPGELDPLAVARREGIEETALRDLRPWPSARVQHVAVVPVPASVVEPAHLHADVRFFLATDDPGAAQPETDAAPLRWLSVADAIGLTTEENVRETIRRAGRLIER